MEEPQQGNAPQEQMDAVLDAALDELDDDDDDFLMASPSLRPEEEAASATIPVSAASKNASIIPPQEGPTRPPVAAGNVPPGGEMYEKALDDMMKQLLSSGGGDDSAEAALGAFVQQIQSQLVSEMQETNSRGHYQAPPNTPASPPISASKPPATSSTTDTDAVSDEDDVNRTISKLMEDMSMPSEESTAGTVDAEEALLNDMMKGFENMGDFSSDDVIDGMMKQLLSKDLMYEPMKQVTEKFPAWLEEHKGELSDQDFQQRTHQYESFRQLIRVYEQEPENTERLMELMQEAQEFGQPPPEIIQDIAPGLELDAEGLPQINGNGENPFGNEECRIM